MKRRDFVYTGAAVVSAELLARTSALAQTAPVNPVLTTVVTGTPIDGGVLCQDVLFDGQKFISLYRTPAPAPTAQYWIAGTAPSGSLLWSYPLPAGLYSNLGTHAGMVVVNALRYQSPSGTMVRNPILLLDPLSGAISNTGSTDGKGPFVCAGDSLFFRVVAGQGEIWSFDGSSLAAGVSGMVAQSFSTVVPPFYAATLKPAGAVVVPSQGQWIARVSASPATVQEAAISCDYVTAVRTFYQTSRATRLSNQGIDPSDKRYLIPDVISTIGSDENGVLYALVMSPADGVQGVRVLVRFDGSGSGSVLGKISLPPNTLMSSKLFVAGSHLGVVSPKGTLAWYPVPLA